MEMNSGVRSANHMRRLDQCTGQRECSTHARRSTTMEERLAADGTSASAERNRRAETATRLANCRARR
jgi:hypothetical protein